MPLALASLVQRAHALVCVCVFSSSLQYEIRGGGAGGVVAWKMGQTLWTGIRIFLSSCFPCFTSYDDYDFQTVGREKKKIGGRRWVVVGGGGDEVCACSSVVEVLLFILGHVMEEGWADGKSQASAR